MPFPVPDDETKDEGKQRRKAQGKRRGAVKAQLVATLRARLPESTLSWLDAALVLSAGGVLRFPQLLGTGGNDGRLEFTNNLMQRLVSEGRPPGLFDAALRGALPGC